MDAMNWLMFANAAFWLGLGFYIAFMGRAQARLEKRVRQWDDNHG